MPAVPEEETENDDLPEDVTVIQMPGLMFKPEFLHTCRIKKFAVPEFPFKKHFSGLRAPFVTEK